MPDSIEYYYGMLSPFAFLGHQRFMKIAERHSKFILFRPSDFIERIFARTGGLKLHERAPARQAYRLQEIARWSEHLGIPMNIRPKHFPVRDELAARFAIAVNWRGLSIGDFTYSVLKAVWQQDRDVSNPDTLVEIAIGLNMPGRELLDEATSPEALAALETNCNEAVARGVFGTPSYVYNEEVFWGQDRLDFLERALSR